MAAIAVGAVVALAIVTQSDDSDGGTTSGAAALPDPAEEPQGGGATPSFDDTSLPPLPSPSEFIADPEKDTAPFRADDFFPSETATISDRTYDQVATHGVNDCAAAASPELGAVLEEHGCEALLRATFTREGVAVTVGVAQFPSEEDAVAARDAAVPNLLPLTSGDAPSFCQGGGCRTTSNQTGRYAYFTIAGNADGSPDSGEDTPAQQAARDGDSIAFNLIVQRGEAQASASASALVEERENQS